jgi:hypothetical protein
MVRSEEDFKEIVNEPNLEYHTLEVQMEKGETTEISFPNSLSLVARTFILDNHSSLPSSYNHPPQESLVQHFPTANFDDLEERVNQLMAARHAHTQPPYTYVIVPKLVLANYTNRFAIKWLCKCECRTHRESSLSKNQFKMPKLILP